MLQDALKMFIILSLELTFLFLAISYLVGLLQEFLTPEKIQLALSSRNGRGYIIASFLGAVTPFCSCSTIPFLKGLLRAKAAFGPMMVFLFASPLLNPIIIGLFAVTFGIKVTLFYFIMAMGVSIIAGIILEKLNFDRYIKEEAYIVEEEKTSCCAATPKTEEETEAERKKDRYRHIARSTWKDFKQAAPYLFIGIAIGSFIYGFIPTELITKYAGENKWYAIPIAAVIGIPLYIRAETVIPLSAALVKKGMALGSVMALIIGSAGASLTEVILLKSIFKNQMIMAFLTVILLMAMIAGWLFGALQGIF